MIKISKYRCPICNKELTYRRDSLGKYLYCPYCDKGWCPNIYLSWHKIIELSTVKNSRGTYHVCPECHWYSGIDKESEESIISEMIFIDTLKNILKDSKEIEIENIKFESIFGGETPWYTLKERLKKFGKIKTCDINMYYKDRLVLKFELKAWKNYTIKSFFFTKRAYVNIHEAHDAAQHEGFVCFVTLKDRKVICTRASDIINEWKRHKIRLNVSKHLEKDILDAFKKGIRVVIAPDKQGNLRYVLSQDFKKRYCKPLEEFKDEIIKIILKKIK